MGDLRIELLGPVRVTVDGAPLRVDTRKAVALLALLAVDGAQQREKVAGLLWSDSEPSRARGALRRTLSVLSRALGDRWLVVDRSVLRLETAGVACDVTETARLLAAVRAHHDDGALCAACVDELRQVVASHRGGFLDGFSLRDSIEFDDWRVAHEERLRRELCRALDLLAGAEAAAGDLEATQIRLERWLRVDPLNERVHGKLMLVHAWRGERTEAIRRYRTCVDVLDRELGVTPLARTSELYRAVIDDRIPVRPPSRPVRREAFETSAADPDHALPPTDAAAPAAAATVLARAREGPTAGRPASGGPRPATTTWPLVGRDELLSELLAVHADGGCRAVLVTGEAGVGKTRLVDELIGHLEHRGIRTATARCYPSEVGVAFGAIVELLRQAVNDSPRSRIAEIGPYDLAEVARLLPDLLGDRELPSVSPLDSPGAQGRFLVAVWNVLAATLSGHSYCVRRHLAVTAVVRPEQLRVDSLPVERGGGRVPHRGRAPC